MNSYNCKYKNSYTQKQFSKFIPILSRKIIFKSKNYTRTKIMLHWKRHSMCELHKFLHTSEARQGEAEQ